MNARTARIAGLLLTAILIAALPLLISLFSSVGAGGAAPTPTAVALATASPVRPESSPTLDLRAAATLPINSTPAPSPTPTLECPSPATPEPLWVDPVLSPTSALTQTLYITLGRGREVSVTSEAGTVSVPGRFTIAEPAELVVPLLPNQTNNLVVSGRVEYAPGCFYILTTRIDRTGKPLVIVQQSATPTPGAPVTVIPPLTLSPTTISAPPIGGSVYLKPFSQIFALSQAQPEPPGQVWLYQGAGELFTVLGHASGSTHLMSSDSRLDFWTLTTNLSNMPPSPPQFDSTIGGRTVELIPGDVFVCRAVASTASAVGECTELNNPGSVTLMERATSDGSVLYRVDLGGTEYWVSANALAIPP